VQKGFEKGEFGFLVVRKSGANYFLEVIISTINKTWLTLNKPFTNTVIKHVVSSPNGQNIAVLAKISQNSGLFVKILDSDDLRIMRNFEISGLRFDNLVLNTLFLDDFHGILGFCVKARGWKDVLEEEMGMF